MITLTLDLLNDYPEKLEAELAQKWITDAKIDLDSPQQYPRTVGAAFRQRGYTKDSLYGLPNGDGVSIFLTTREKLRFGKLLAQGRCDDGCAAFPVRTVGCYKDAAKHVVDWMRVRFYQALYEESQARLPNAPELDEEGPEDYETEGEESVEAADQADPKKWFGVEKRAQPFFESDVYELKLGDTPLNVFSLDSDSVKRISVVLNQSKAKTEKLKREAHSAKAEHGKRESDFLNACVNVSALAKKLARKEEIIQKQNESLRKRKEQATLDNRFKEHLRSVVEKSGLSWRDVTEEFQEKLPFVQDLRREMAIDIESYKQIGEQMHNATFDMPIKPDNSWIGKSPGLGAFKVSAAREAEQSKSRLNREVIETTKLVTPPTNIGWPKLGRAESEKLSEILNEAIPTGTSDNMTSKTCVEQVQPLIDQRGRLAHTLKTIQPFWDDIKAGRKLFDVREYAAQSCGKGSGHFYDVYNTKCAECKPARDFQIGDTAFFVNKETGEELEREIVYVLRDTDCTGFKGIAPGFCVLGWAGISKCE